jgi:hypothetical protein
MTLLIAVLLLFVAPALASAQARPPEFSVPPASEWVHIDGSKNPELIPEWSVWQAAFRSFLLVGQLPTAVAQHISKEEAAMVLGVAKEHGQSMNACEERAMKLMPLLQKETAEVINRKTEALNLECRSRTLRLRDRALDGLGPDGQVALRGWVESTKATIQVSVPKRELDFYLKPK